MEWKGLLTMIQKQISELKSGTQKLARPNKKEHIQDQIIAHYVFDSRSIMHVEFVPIKFTMLKFLKHS